MAKFQRIECGFPQNPQRNLPVLIILFHLLYLLLPMSIALAPILSLVRLYLGVSKTWDMKVLGFSVVYYSTWVMTSKMTKKGGENRFLNSNLFGLLRYAGGGGKPTS